MRPDDDDFRFEKRVESVNCCDANALWAAQHRARTHTRARHRRHTPRVRRDSAAAQLVRPTSVRPADAYARTHARQLVRFLLDIAL